MTDSLEDLARRAHFPAPALSRRRFTPAEFWLAVDHLGQQQAGLTVEEVGRSIEGRPLRTVTAGAGPTTVLLWSQMHGDEPTTTMALADLLHFLAAGAGPLRDRLLTTLRIVCLPLLNPDGAEVGQRENALGIDINRDARRLASPEARTLMQVRRSLQPAYGFNLHNMDPRRTAGPGGMPVALAFLSPPADAAGSWTPARCRAREVAGSMVNTLAGPLEGRLARWPESFDPRAFGEHMQQHETATVLVECGSLPADPETQTLRHHTTAALLAGLSHISHGMADHSASYDCLPENCSVEHDVHLLGGEVRLQGGRLRADIAVRYDDPLSRHGARLAELGDLGAAGALETLQLDGATVTLEASGKICPGVPIRIRAERPDGGAWPAEPSD